MHYELCPHSETCPIYENWVEQTKDDRLGIIIYSDGIGYSCTALGALEDPVSEGGILFNDELRRRIKEKAVEKNIGVRETKCSHITLLNSSIKEK